jgi:hypothetical protein
LSSFARILACCAVIVLCLALCNSAIAAGPAAQSAPGSTVAKGPKIWLQESQSLAVTHVGPAAGGMIGGSAQPLSMVAEDVDRDGVQDLLVGYSTPGGGVVVLHRGNLDAFAPQSEASFQAIANSQFPSPFLPEAQVFAVPATPDFMAVGDFTGHGLVDLAVAARGGSAIYILEGDGKGQFVAGDTINLPGGVTALAADRFGKIQSALLVGVSSGRQSFLAVYGSGAQGFSPLAALPLKAPASNLLFGQFGDLYPDAALLSGGQVFILRSSNMQLVKVGLPVSVSAFALGSFLFDRNGGSQIAVLGVDGSIQIAVRNEFDPRTYTNEEFRAIRQARLRSEAPPLIPAHTFAGNGWRIAEGFPGLGSVTPGQPPVFFRTRISINGADDISWLNAANGQMVLISHPDQQPGAATFLPGLVSVKSYNGLAFQALPMRTNVDSRLGVVALHQGQIVPSLSMPIPDPTFTVNRFDDPTPVSPITNACNGVANDCSLREAILRSNGDTVVVPAGTYTLTIAKVANDCTGNFGALSVEHTTTIVGAGQNTTIIQAGTASYNPGPANGVDMVMNVNEDLATAACPLTNASASISNLTLQNGHNRGTHGNDGDGGCMEFDTGSAGTAALSLTNVTLQNCDTTQGSGGGLANFNFEVPTGTSGATISNSIIQGNSTADNSGGSSTAAGGGIWVSDPSRITMTNSQVLNNQSIQDTATTGIGAAGGLLIISKGTPGEIQQTQIHSSIISGNKAAFAGGAISDDADLLIDSGTIISGNKNGQGASGTHVAAGGGLFINPSIGLSATLSKVTITNNQSTGTGGGIATGALQPGPGTSSGPVTISFSRFAANTAATTGSNLENLGNADTVTNNWWGTNAAASTIHTVTSGGLPGTTAFDPFIVLTHTSSPHPIRINGTATLTANMSLDNHGVGTALSGNLDELIQLPLTFDGAVLGTIPQAQPETLSNPVPTAVAGFNAGGISGLGDAVATLEKNAPGFENYAVHVNTNLVANATESGTTATITTVGAHGFTTSDFVTITGVAGAGTCSGYNGNFFPITGTTTTTFTYTAPAGLSTCSGGTASIGLVVLEPPSIAKAFGGSKVVQSTSFNSSAFNTITFSITNANVVPIDASFTDNLPTVGGPNPGSLVVASTPGVTNTCTGTVTATAGAGVISFSTTTLPVGTCTITVRVSSAVDDQYSNSVTIDSTAAGNGNTSSDTLNVINPPHSTKSFGAATIPLQGTTSLTITVDNGNNLNQTLSAITFTDTLPTAPGKLVVATPSGLIDNCSGGATAAAGSGSISLASSTLSPGASCTVSANVQGTVPGAANNSVTASDATAGAGNTATANLTVVPPLVISKAFNPISIALNANSTLTFTIANPATVTQTGVAFADTLPAGLVVATPNGLTDTCGGTATAAAGGNSITLTGGSVAAAGTCAVGVNVTGTAAGLFVNTSGAVSSTEGGTGNTATANLTVVAPPSIAKAFNPTTIPVGGTTILTFTLTNPSVNTVHELGVAFSDSLPLGLTVATPNGLSNTCSGTPVATAGSSSISLAGGDIGVNTSCSVSVNITSVTSGVYINTSGAVSSTNGGTGNTATANLTVALPPTIAKAFNPTTVPLNANSTLTFTLTNPAANTFALTGVAFTDTLPAGMVVATPNGLTDSCGGTAAAAAGGNSITLTGGTIAVNSTCNVVVNVTGTTAGTLVNTSGTVTSSNGGPGNTATATLTVTAASTSTAVASSSNPSVFGQGVTFTATVTDTSAGSIAQPTGSVQFVVDGVNFGSPVPLAGASSNSSSATSQATATLPVTGSPHSVTANYVNADGNFVNSTGSLAGGQTVTIASTTTAVVSSSNPSVFGQPVTFTATITDISPGSTAQPTGSVQFVVDGVNFGTPVTLTGASSTSSTATSQATATLSIAGSPHSVTANYVNADGNFSNSAASLSGGQIVNAAGTTITVTPSVGTITLGDTVTFTATVTANPPASGTPTGIVIFFDGSTPIGGGKLSGGQTTFSTAVLAVGSHSITAIYNGDANFAASPLSSPITETVNLRGSTTGLSLNPTTVAAGQASTTTVTVTDAGASTPPGTPDTFTATGAPATGRIGFTATLIADGAVVVIGGTDANGAVLKSAEFYNAGSFSPTPGSLNTARTGAVAVLLGNGKVLVAGGSSDGSANGALNSAELLDLNSGTFAPTSNHMTAARFGMTATLLNNGKVLIAGGQNSGGVVNSAELYDPAADTFTATGNLNAARTGASATLLGTGKVLVAGGSSDGTVGGALNSAEVFDPAGNAGAGTFTSVAGANPTLATGRWQPEAALLLSGKVLIAGGQNSIGPGPVITADIYDPAADSFTASAHQMNEARANGSAVALPSGMVLLAGGTTSQTAELYDAEGDKFNLTGSVLHHDDGLVSTLLNNGRVLVVGLNTDNPAPFVSDAELYSPSFNPLGTVGFGSSEPTDVFGPACVLTPSTSTASTCTSTVTPIQVATSPHTITGTYPVDAVHSGSSNTASLTVIPTAPPTISKNFSVLNVAQNSTVNVTFTIVNPNPASTLTGISFTDSLPAGLVVATPNNLNSNCGGTFTAVAGSSSLSLTGGTVGPPLPPPMISPGKVVQGVKRTANPPAAGQCVVSVDLLVTGTGTLNNTTGTISANESGPGNPSNTATLNVVLAPTLNKAFGAASIPLSGTTSLTFNIANPNTNVPLVGIAFADTLPSGLVVANPNGATGSCLTVAGSVTTAGTLTAVSASGSISLSGLALNPSGSCSVTVNVTGKSAGTQTNTTAPITATFDDGSGTFRIINGGTASASVVVVAPPSIGKAFLPVAVAPGGVSTLTFTITNPSANTAALAGVAFTDVLPTNLVVATPNGLTGNCNGGTATAVAGTATISLTGGTIPAASSCAISVTVTSSVVGTYVNITGAVSSTNGGTGNIATATFTVGHSNLSITKTHVGNFPRNSRNNNYTITVSNGATGAPTVGTVTVVDTLPNVNNTLVPTAMTGTGWTCTLATLTCTRSDSLALGASYPPITLTVTVPQNIQANVVNSATVSGGNDLNSHTANDPTHIGPPVELTPQGSNNAEVVAGGITSVVITVDSNPAEGMLTMSCSGLPAGTTCAFNPPTTTALSTPVTVVFGTTLGASARPPASGPGLGVYAMLFPVFGVVLVGASAKRDRKRLRRLAVVLAIGLLLVLLTLSGCGGLERKGGTPSTVTQVTVTATSATTGDAGSTTINLTVLNPAPTSH